MRACDGRIAEPRTARRRVALDMCGWNWSWSKDIDRHHLGQSLGGPEVKHVRR